MASVAVLTTGILSGCESYKKKNSGKADLEWYMGLSHQKADGTSYVDTTKAGDSVAAVALEDGYSDNYAIIKGNDAFINIETVSNVIDKRFYWDKKNDYLMFTDASTVYTCGIGTNYINDGVKDEKANYKVSIVEGKKLFINVKFIKRFHDLDYAVSKKSGKTPARVFLAYTNDKKTMMEISEDTQIRTKGNYQNLVVSEVKEGTVVSVIETGKNWNKVITREGYVGYVPVSDLGSTSKKQPRFKTDDDTYTHITLDNQVSMVWFPIYNQGANKTYNEKMKHTKGVDVVSPTWFSIDDKRGNLSTLAELDFVEAAHKDHVQVWALVDDFKNKSYTKTVLKNTKLRNRLVKNIMFYMDGYEIDGVNVDFEHISADMKDDYLQFIRELAIQCRKEKKVLSIDNYAQTLESDIYDLAHQYKVADYVVMMNYDEHTKGSPKAGSVASIPFVDSAINNALKHTKKGDRVINGMPFYTRAWVETPVKKAEDKSGVLVKDAVMGDYYLTVQTLSMSEAKDAYKRAKAKPKYDNEAGQNYVTYNKKGINYEIWLEDKTSIKARMELINKYNLGGGAFWSLGQESDDVWDTIYEYTK